MARGIYCLIRKPEEAFNTEHVLNRAYGAYEPLSFVLDFQVCSNCNNELGRTIDQDLARSTFEGFKRFSHGIKNQEDFEKTKYGRNLDFKVKDGLLKGLDVVPVSSPADDKIIIVPGQDIGLKKNRWLL